MAVCELLIAVASLTVKQALGTRASVAAGCGFSSATLGL